MIVFIDGVVINKALDRVTINVNGLGYECYISSTTFDSLPKEGKLVSLHTYLSISENNHTLFAFSSLDEKSLFQLLISVNGRVWFISSGYDSIIDKKQIQIGLEKSHYPLQEA